MWFATPRLYSDPRASLACQRALSFPFLEATLRTGGALTGAKGRAAGDSSLFAAGEAAKGAPQRRRLDFAFPFVLRLRVFD